MLDNVVRMVLGALLLGGLAGCPHPVLVTEAKPGADIEFGANVDIRLRIEDAKKPVSWDEVFIPTWLDRRTRIDDSEFHATGVAEGPLGVAQPIRITARSGGWAKSFNSSVTVTREVLVRTIDDAPGMNRRHTRPVRLSIDLECSFDADEVDRILVYIDTGELNWNKQVCERDQLSEFCEDRLEIIGAHAWKRDIVNSKSATEIDRIDIGEQQWYSSETNSRHFDAIRRELADGQFEISVTPSRGDQVVIHFVFVRVEFKNEQGGASIESR